MTLSFVVVGRHVLIIQICKMASIKKKKKCANVIYFIDNEKKVSKKLDKPKILQQGNLLIFSDIFNECLAGAIELPPVYKCMCKQNLGNTWVTLYMGSHLNTDRHRRVREKKREKKRPFQSILIAPKTTCLSTNRTFLYQIFSLHFLSTIQVDKMTRRQVF